MGQPDDKTLLRAAGRAARVTVYAYRSGAELWWAPIADQLARAKHLAVWRIPTSASRMLSTLAARSMRLQCTIQDGGLWVSDAAQNVRSNRADRTGCAQGTRGVASRVLSNSRP